MPSDQARDIAVLKEHLLNESIRFGRFTLASGQQTDTYVDAKLTTCLPQAMPYVGRAFLRKMEDLGWEPDAVGGLTVGADPIAFAIARESLVERPEPVKAFIVRKDPKKHGMQRFIEGIEGAAGLRVVIIDDVCTSGGSTAQAINNAKKAGMHVIGAICLVDREEGAERKLHEECDCALHSIFRLSSLVAAKRDSYTYASR